MNIKLTAEQIRQIDEITNDKEAVERTLTIALTFASNRLNQLRKQEMQYWTELSAIHNFDYTAANYSINIVRGEVVVVEADK